MSTDDELRCYDYVNAAYPRVRDLLCSDAVGVFARATRAAAARAQSLVAQLELRVGSMSIATDVDLQVGAPEQTSSPFAEPATRLPISWRAAHRPRLFPLMRASLTMYALSTQETQLVLIGRYDPPFGVLGEALDALAGRRVAEACVLRFLQEVAAQLRHELGSEARCE